MRVLHFSSGFNNLGSFTKPYSEWPDQVIKNEPMLFNCDVEFAIKNAGPITRTFLNKVLWLDHSWMQGVVDTRVHMLMKNWFPCIPGWHHDDVPRTRADKQPNYHDPSCQADHIMGLVNGDICPTQFIQGKVTLKEPPIGKTVYEVWNKDLTKMLKRGKIKSIPVPSETLIGFDYTDFHTGVPAIKSGWRWFGRISRHTTRKPTNEIRRQVQVYLDAIDAGW